MSLGDELGRSDIGHPNLYWAQPLAAQALMVLTHSLTAPARRPRSRRSVRKARRRMCSRSRGTSRCQTRRSPRSDRMARMFGVQRGDGIHRVLICVVCQPGPGEKSTAAGGRLSGLEEARFRIPRFRGNAQPSRWRPRNSPIAYPGAERRRMHVIAPGRAIDEPHRSSRWWCRPGRGRRGAVVPAD